jgi:hypothetical protein
MCGGSFTYMRAARGYGNRAGNRFQNAARRIFLLSYTRPPCHQGGRSFTPLIPARFSPCRGKLSKKNTHARQGQIS